MLFTVYRLPRAAYCGATKGQLETLRLLADNGGGDLWMRSSRGDVALHEAVASGRKELVLWLLRQQQQQQQQQKGQAVAGTNVANNDGRTPLHVAAVNNNLSCNQHFILHLK